MCIFLYLLTQVEDRPFCFLEGPFALSEVSFNGVMQLNCCAGGEIESGAFQSLKHSGRIEIVRFILKRVPYNQCLGVTGSKDDCHSIRIECNGSQADSNHQACS